MKMLGNLHDFLTGVLTGVTEATSPQLMALVCLGALAVVAFGLYVVLAAIKKGKP